MPGIFGFRLRRPGLDADRIAERLAGDLRLFAWQRQAVLSTSEPGVRLGVVWNELASAARGASFFADEHVSCVLVGYIARTREDCSAATALAESRHAEAAVLAYRRFGTGFAARLEGPFALILYDDRDGGLYGVTERHSLTALYRHDGPNGVCFSSMLGPLARSGLFEARVDAAAIATQLGHSHLFYRQTLLRDVELQDAAVIATSRPGEMTCKIERYWHYGWDGPRDNAPFARKIDDVCDTLLEATDRIVELPGRLGASLSGGLDSRLMVGLAHRQGAEFTPWTFGTPGASDLQVAAEVCRTLGLGHDVFQPSADHIPEYAADYATILNGCGPLRNAFALDRCHAYRGRVDLMLNGYRGGVVLGKAIVDLGHRHRLRWWRGRLKLEPPVISPNLEDARDDALMGAYYVALSHQATPAIAGWLVEPELPLATMLQEAFKGPLTATPPEYRIEQWTEEYGGGRHMTLVSIFADRHFFNDASVFYDYDVRDRCFALRPVDRRGNKAYAAVLTRLLPNLATLTYANTGLPANYTGLRLLAHRLWRQSTGRRTARSGGFNATDWLRAPRMAEFCRDLMHDRSFLARPWWRGEAIAADFDDCMRGDPRLIAELWNAVTIELFARRWLDRSTGETA
ncbi:MAG: asparagine synthase-related protein [Candidatus Krumholzibacteria bacterium]|jgi:hypothetical protein|nr:asparagine synthase-related protein [Candidatus Krumholzibacteria bacterium]